LGANDHLFARSVLFALRRRRFYYAFPKLLSATFSRRHARTVMARDRAKDHHSTHARSMRIEKDRDVEIQLVEIIRALARAAAREDHRKAIEAEARSSAETNRR